MVNVVWRKIGWGRGTRKAEELIKILKKASWDWALWVKHWKGEYTIQVIWGKRNPGKGDIKCKGPETGACLKYWNSHFDWNGMRKGAKSSRGGQRGSEGHLVVDLVSHGKELGFYLEIQSHLEDFEQRYDMIWLMFQKDCFGFCVKTSLGG